MKKNWVLCDTNIFISAFEGDSKTTEILQNKIKKSNVLLSSITYMELCRGALNKKQLNKLRKNLKGYRILNFNEKVSSLAMDLITKYHLSHGLQIPDAIIAASARAFRLKLFTFNKKDFNYIPGIKLYEA